MSNPKNLKDHWDNLWRLDSKVSIIRNFINKLGEEACWKIYDKLLNKTNLRKLKKVKIIELGSGSGAITRKILIKYPNSGAILIDYSTEALEYSKKNTEIELINRIKFINADVINYNSNNKYDLVHSGGLIEHFSGDLQDKIIQKHLDLCAENGFIIIMVPAPVFWYKIMRLIFETTGRWPKHFEKPLSLIELKELCYKNGIQVLYGIKSSGLTRSSTIIGTKQLIK